MLRIVQKILSTRRQPGAQDGIVCKSLVKFKVVVPAEILPRDFLQTPGNYYL